MPSRRPARPIRSTSPAVLRMYRSAPAGSTFDPDVDRLAHVLPEEDVSGSLDRLRRSAERSDSDRLPPTIAPSPRPGRTRRRLDRVKLGQCSGEDLLPVERCAAAQLDRDERSVERDEVGGVAM